MMDRLRCVEVGRIVRAPVEVVLEDVWAGCCTKWRHEADNAKVAMKKCRAQPGSTLAVDELMVIADYACERVVDVFSVN